MAGMGLSFISMHTMMLELATGKLVTLNVTGLPIVQRLVCRSPARQEALAHRPVIPCFPARAGRGDHDEGVGRERRGSIRAKNAARSAANLGHCDLAHSSIVPSL